jgi:hypothetical protein
MIEDVNYDEEELVKLREQRYAYMDKIKNLKKNIREINTSINSTKNLVQLMDDQLKEMLDTETSQIVESNFSLFDNWWTENIEIVSEDITSSSTDLWTRFKQDNKLVINDMNISGDKFKQYLKSKVPISAILLRNKNANSAFDIKGIQLKEEEVKVIEEKLEVELNEDVVKKKKVIKKKLDKDI